MRASLSPRAEFACEFHLVCSLRAALTGVGVIWDTRLELGADKLRHTDLVRRPLMFSYLAVPHAHRVAQGQPCVCTPPHRESVFRNQVKQAITLQLGHAERGLLVVVTHCGLEG